MTARLSDPGARCEVCQGPGFITVDGIKTRKSKPPNVNYVFDDRPLVLCQGHLAEAVNLGAPSLNPEKREP